LCSENCRPSGLDGILGDTFAKLFAKLEIFAKLFAKLEIFAKLFGKLFAKLEIFAKLFAKFEGSWRCKGRYLSSHRTPSGLQGGGSKVS
jgi:hypothetical protein